MNLAQKVNVNLTLLFRVPLHTIDLWVFSKNFSPSMALKKNFKANNTHTHSVCMCVCLYLSLSVCVWVEQN